MLKLKSAYTFSNNSLILSTLKWSVRTRSTSAQSSKVFSGYSYVLYNYDQYEILPTQLLPNELAGRHHASIQELVGCYVIYCQQLYPSQVAIFCLKKVLIYLFLSVKGTGMLVTLLSKASFAAWSASSLPCIPIWLGIQQQILIDWLIESYKRACLTHAGHIGIQGNDINR